jgi:sialate O-acetylesterase
MRVQGDSAVISFSEVGDGLMVVPGEKLRGFSIAGNDQRFYPAEARIISENEVAVSNPRVEEPQAVRYGWSNNPDVNLYNESFMPASPFRTDDWTGDEGTESGI